MITNKWFSANLLYKYSKKVDAKLVPCIQAVAESNNGSKLIKSPRCDWNFVMLPQLGEMKWDDDEYQVKLLWRPIHKSQRKC